jgi:hypothetical protein
VNTISTLFVRSSRRIKRLSIRSIAIAVGAAALHAQGPQAPTTVTTTPSIAAPSKPTAPPDAPAIVHGQVVAAETGKPLYRARVRLDGFGNSMSVGRQAMTSRDGRYRFENLAPGQYWIRTSAAAYVELQAGQKHPGDRTSAWTVRSGEAQQLDFALPRGGVITGSINDDSGEPLAGVGVTPLRLEYTFTGAHWRPVYAAPFMGRTDDRGQFRIPGLLPGTYIVVGTSQSDAIGEGYAPTFYPGTTIQGEARHLKIALNEEVAASFSMMATTQVRVTGQVQSSTGELLKNYRATLAGAIDTNRVGARINERTGAFEFMGVAPGAYTLEVTTGPSNIPRGRTPSEFASLSLVVGNDDMTGLLVTTGYGVTLSGRVIYDGAPVKNETQPRYRPRVRVTFVDGLRAFFRPAGAENNGIIADDGSFTITGTHGRVLLVPDIPEWQLRSVMLDGVDITDVPYDTSRGSTNRLEIVVTDQKQELTGKVVTASGKPATEFRVLAFPRNVKPGTVAGRYAPRGSNHGSDGSFRLTGLPPGEYYAVALTSMAENAQFDSELHEALKPRATPFQLSPGETATIELTLIE